MACQLEVPALMKGRHVYVWAPLTDCSEDDGPVGRYTCAETQLSNGRVQASCELERDVNGAMR